MKTMMLRAALVALSLSTFALSVSQASAHGPMGGSHFFPIGHGPVFRDPGFGGHRPNGWGGWPHGRGSWGGYGYGYDAGYYETPVYGCSIKRTLDEEGGIIFRKVCY